MPAHHFSLQLPSAAVIGAAGQASDGVPAKRLAPVQIPCDAPTRAGSTVNYALRQLLDVSRNCKRVDLVQFEPPVLAPVEELFYPTRIADCAIRTRDLRGGKRCILTFWQARRPQVVLMLYT
jgi:hypothetical protein